MATELLADSPFRINTALDLGTPGLEQRLDAMQQAGIKWARQDFTWKRIERRKGEYDWKPYDKLVENLHQHGILLFGNLTYGPDFHDIVEVACGTCHESSFDYLSAVAQITGK